MNSMDDDKRRKNIRLAWILGGLAVLVMISAVPFWTGLVSIAAGNG